MFRVPALTVVAIALSGLAACSDAQTADTNAQAAAAQAGKATEAAANAAPAVSGDATALDRQLAELGWAGAAASTYAYAQACGADATKLDTFKRSQREQAGVMGSDAATFDSRFPKALELAQRRVELDDVAMADAHRADTCRTTLGYLQ